MHSIDTHTCVDPNKFRFRTVLRILSLVFLFLENISKKCGIVFNFQEKLGIKEQRSTSEEYFVTHITFGAFTSHKPKVVIVCLPEEMLKAAKVYFFQKASLEVKEFVDPSRYKNNLVLKCDILYYTGRILASQEIHGKCSLGDVCLDFAANSFCVPITDAHSPIAYAIVLEAHWYHPDVSHGGVESVLRHSQNMAYIIGGRVLVKGIQKECTKCGILNKKAVHIAMGPVGDNNLHIAPPFYLCQVDLCGPFSAYSPVNKRATLKMWYVVFCCTVTGATDCRIMENYTSDAFLLAFARFACRFGYPKTVMPDESGQLVSRCRNMVISFSDVQYRLNIEYGIKFKTCGKH